MAAKVNEQWEETMKLNFVFCLKNIRTRLYSLTIQQVVYLTIYTLRCRSHIYGSYIRGRTMQQMAFCGGVDRFYPLLAIHNNNGLVYISASP
ncbi:hypothetical protein OUZ56_001596 [Daphnia magna]|uniref:Uncharacterized protein n=1 Tax=Daphnia magna TaxID=35525 RepID=A0ABR0A355_9CRUS|nr:hypothetical protein OUZ56_001596 [Daphnia magna]